MGGKPKKGDKRTWVPPDVTEDELKYIYRNRKGKVIFTPVYKIYNKAFVNELIANTSFQTVYEGFQDTSLYERYMLNAVQFSAAKSAAEAKLLQAAVFDEDKKARSFSDFKEAAQEITDISQMTWLRVEYDMARRQAVQGEAWCDMEKDKDLYPYWVYHGMMDDREREEHVEMEGLVFKIGDPAGDAVFPPADWNCLKGEALILTKKGWRRIDSLQIGETVIGGSGNECQIRFVHINPFNGQMIGLVCKGNTVFYTDNHRVLTHKGWVASGSLNIGNILIQNRKFGFRNAVIAYVNNCYSYARYLCMPGKIKWQPGMVKAFDCYVQFWNKNIGPNVERFTDVIVNAFKPYGINVVHHQAFASGGIGSGIDMLGQVIGNRNISGNSGFFNYFRPKKGATNFKFSSNVRQLFAKIGMGKGSNIFTHFFGSLLFPFICIYPLALYCFAAVSDWYIAMIEKCRNNSIVAYFPSLAQLAESIRLKRVQFVQANGDGAPLHSFNSSYVFLYSLFFHFKLALIADVNIKEFSGEVYNLDIQYDISYITQSGIVHNCRCEGDQIDDQEVDEKGLRVQTEMEAQSILESNVDEQFRYNPATQGMMPKTGSYFEAAGSANDLSAKNFSPDNAEEE